VFKSILVPIDVQHESSWRTVLPVAARIAGETGAKMHVLCVVPPIGLPLVGAFFPEDYESKAVEASKAALADIVSRTELGEVRPQMHVTRGVVYEAILACAEELGSDLIVLAAHRPELKDYLLGPNAARVVRHARQSVFVVRD
jgi:nucleotide-binding universal stress UspA family protein